MLEVLGLSQSCCPRSCPLRKPENITTNLSWQREAFGIGPFVPWSKAPISGSDLRRTKDEQEVRRDMGHYLPVRLGPYVYSLAWAAVTKYHVSGLNNRNLFTHGSGN